MLSLSRARKITGTAGDPLPPAFQALSRSGVTLNRGELSLFAAAPGGGKSVLAMVTALRVGVPTLYWSADTPAFQMYDRVAAHLLNRRMSEVRDLVDAGNTRTLDAKLANVNHIWWEFGSRIDANLPEGGSISPFRERLEAFAVTYGEYPHLLVVDNIKNFYVGDSGEDLDRYRSATEYLNQEIARKLNVAVVATHHVTGRYNDGDQPIPLSGVKGQITEEASMVLTLYRDNNGTMFVCPVKNRSGQADGGGSWKVHLHYDPARMMLQDTSR